MPLGTHQKIFLGWFIFASLGVSAFAYCKSSAFIDRDEALRLREELKRKLESEKRMAQFNVDQSKMQLITELEQEMVADMYNRLTRACQRKCIVRKYKDAELSKGESVCIDRCVAKYIDIHDKIGKKLTSLSKQDEEAFKKLQEQQESAMKAATNK